MGKETEQKQEIVNQGVHTYSQEEAYVWPEEPVLREQLEWFQDQKLALMVHWGVYNQLGMVASWALSDEDAEWSRKTVDWTDDGEVFKRQYRALNRAFDPVAFQPEEWAKMAKECGFRYLILTTKHHDGFCLWDTAYTEYKTTAEDCPFHTHKYADIVCAMFDAFRKEKLGIGVYYSKADWHCPDYWEKEKVFTGKTTRNPTYDPKENPEAWERFRAFTRDQILELGKQYGRLDILWFDAGWVAATNGQDIRLGEIVEEVRKTQPWVLAVDRTVGGAYENYVTPEMCVPEKPLRVPWESCLTLGADFNYAYGDHYKSPRELVNLAESLGLDALVEAHDEREVERALEAGAKIVGVNNRDLRTFRVDMNNSIRLRNLAPEEVVFVSESGIRTSADINLLYDNRVDAVLIGETLMRSPDKKAMLETLNGKPLSR